VRPARAKISKRHPSFKLSNDHLIHDSLTWSQREMRSTYYISLDISPIAPSLRPQILTSDRKCTAGVSPEPRNPHRSDGEWSDDSADDIKGGENPSANGPRDGLRRKEQPRKRGQKWGKNETTHIHTHTSPPKWSHLWQVPARRDGGSFSTSNGSASWDTRWRPKAKKAILVPHSAIRQGRKGRERDPFGQSR
jgi:hypothetical protein